MLVRGLPNFTTTYNGREIFTAETRVVALQDFPSSNIAALEVFKTSIADLVEPGLAGLSTSAPASLSTSPAARSPDRSGRSTPARATIFRPISTFSPRSAGRSAMAAISAVLLNVSRTDMRYLDAETTNTDFLQTFRQAGNVLVADAGAGQAARFPDIQRLFYRSGRRIRPSVNAAAQFRPKPGLEFYVEGLWQGFRNRIDDRLMAAELFNGAQVSSLQFRDGTNLVRKRHGDRAAASGISDIDADKPAIKK